MPTTGNAEATPEFARIEVIDDTAAIWLGDRRIAPLEGGAHSLINAIYQHMLTDHGERDARIYLTGVIHGLREAASHRMAEIVREIEANRAERKAAVRP